MTAQDRIDVFRNRLTAFLVGSFVGALMLMIFYGMPTTSKDIVTYMVGQLSGMTLMALGLYFTKGAGQEAADEAKTANTGKMAEAITAAAKAGTTDSDQPDVLLKPGETAQAEAA